MLKENGYNVQKLAFGGAPRGVEPQLKAIGLSQGDRLFLGGELVEYR
jgi:hypothetical protein